jgi:hypothetical protein
VIRESEDALRSRLGIPADSTEVVVVAESSHWDPNWLMSSDRYYRSCVRPSIDRALDALAAEPRRVFSLECLFFVDLYWRDRPERRPELVELVNEGRLRFTGCGVTTPDTLLPEDELLLRDLLVGQEWLRSRGMDQEPRLLYLPDSFGHSPGLPALLAAGGFDYAAVCRIDGMRFPGADMEPATNFPRPGTSAAHLLTEGTADFVWRSVDGSEVLTHWMAHGYGHGDMIASGGLSRIMGLPAAWPDRRPGRVDARIDRYLTELRCIARTPYRLLAIGYDFVRPVPRLVELLDDWNVRHHERTGTWLVNAAIDDYLDLVSHHRDDLPTIELDPNPYWMGFYATRPGLKASARELGRRLLAVDAHEATSVLTGTNSQRIPPAQRAQWWIAATSNHHDFVTGTAPDRVARKEQAAWLTSAIDATPWPDPRPDEESAPGELTVRHERRRTVVTTPWGSATFDSGRGGALIGLTDHTGTELLAGPSLELRAYADGGGLWRLGNEFYGGRWSLTDASTQHPATIRVDHDGEVAHVHVRVALCGRISSLHHTIRSDDPTIVTRSSVDVPNRRTVTLVVHPRAATSGITMHQPGGVVERPLRRWYEPTYWPLHSFAVTEPGRSDPAALAIATATPTGLHVESDGTTEVIVARTAVKEIAFGVIPVMAPAWGRAWEPQDAVMVLGWHEPDQHMSTDLHRSTVGLGRRLAAIADREVGHMTPSWPVDVSDPEVEISAVKAADRNGGIIVRLRNWAAPATPRTVTVTLKEELAADILGAQVTDSRERDLCGLAITPHGVEVPIRGHLTTLRILTRGRSRSV